MATRYWYGGAVAIPEVYTLSITGTWLATETAWIEINGKRLTLTVGTSVTIDDVGAAMAAMINGAAAVDDETRSAIGSQVGEFIPLTATYDSTNDNLIITGASDGRPIGTLTADDTSTSGTLAVDGGAVSTAGTGPHHWDNIDNWDSDTVPVNGDTVIFDHQAASSCLYALSLGSLTIANLQISKSFQYNIGLSEVNTDNASYPYDEHLTSYLTLAAATVLTIDGASAGRIKIDTGSAASAIVVNSSGFQSQTQSNVPPILIKANHASTTINVTGGAVGLCFEPGTSGEILSFTVGGPGSPSLQIGNGVTLSSATGTITSGSCITRSAVGTVTISGGSYEHHNGNATAINVDGGTFYPISNGTYATVALVGGTIDASRDSRARTFSAFSQYGRTVLMDPLGSIDFSSGIDLYCKPVDVTWDLPARKTYTLSAV